MLISCLQCNGCPYFREEIRHMCYEERISLLPGQRGCSLQYFEHFGSRLSAGNSILAIYHKERTPFCAQPGCFCPVCFQFIYKNWVGKGFFYLSIRQTDIIPQFC